MAGPLLATKLHVPRVRPGLIDRPRLNERLSRGATTSLTLVSAPAGFGKTTLLTEWLAAVAADGLAVAWLSLDERDNDPVTYWTYAVTALRTAAPSVGATSLSLLESPNPSIEDVLATLLNDLNAVSNEVVLVLDDYHLIDAGDVHDSMAFLIEHLPPQIHLVLAGRADPALPLSRLRGRGELVEIRATDLRFTPDEAAAYLGGAMGLALTADDVAALEGRTEGWIAALQLAALSMQGRDDLTGFIAGFAGDDRYIVDYLAEEVLARQPDDVRHFLLQTSILDRLSGPLCDAVTGRDGGKAMLAALERGNLFLVPLDDRRRWYRYHQLFADVLQAHLLDEQPEVVAGLHSRASAWYAENGEAAEAIRHALAAPDLERAADLVELEIPAMRKARQEAGLRRWLDALPDDVVRARPLLNLGYVGATLVAGEIDGVDGRLSEVERMLDPATGLRRGAQEASADADIEREYQRIPGTVELYRAALALAGGDVADAVTHAHRSLELAPLDDHTCRAAAEGLLGIAAWASGDLDEGYRAYASCRAGLLSVEYVSDALGCTIALSDIRLAQGRLGDAQRTYEHGLRIVREHGVAAQRGTADMHVGLSEIHLERGDLTAALHQLVLAQELGEHAGLPQNRYRWRVAMARLRQAEGDLSGSLDLLEDAERLYVGDYFPNVRPVPAMKARIRLRLGELGEAMAWVSERGLSATDDLNYLTEFEHLTLARVLLARYAAERSDRDLADATRLLERLLQAAEEGERAGAAIEILLQLALARQVTGDLPGAAESLPRALALAEPEGYLRVFVDEGEPMATLLRAAAKNSASPGYVRRLLAAMSTTPASTPAASALIEPLSERELDVLRLLGTDLDGPAIARRLVVSLNTVRTHTKNIYTKLGVNSRRAAVRRAEELDLLSR